MLYNLTVANEIKSNVTLAKLKRHKFNPFGIMEFFRNHFYKGDLCLKICR